MSNLRAEIAQAASARYDALENKAVAGMDREQERDLARFIRRVGGYVQSGGRAADVLDYDGPHFDRAMSLIAGEAAPESDAEVRELERWRAKYPPGKP